MSILTEKLQNAILYKGKKYPINTDFRVWLKFDQIIHKDGEPITKIEEIIRLCVVPGRLPPIPELMQSLFKFYLGDVEEIHKDTNSETKSKAPIFDYEIDAKYILAAFLEVYGIDLMSIAYMHWHKFQSLLWALPEDTRLMKIIGYRDLDTAKIKDKTRKKAYEKLKKMYSLPDSRTQEEKENSFADELYKL